MTPYLLITTTYAGMITYGIAYSECDDGMPHLIETYPDLSSDASSVERFVDACNRDLLPRRELRRTVEKFLSSL